VTDDDREEKPARGSRWRRIGRAVGDAGLTAGMARGVTGRGHRDDSLLARAAMQGEMSEMGDLHDCDRVRPAGALDRVRGWLVLTVVLAVFAAVVIFTSWQ
jgi:hypothetical protein